MTLRRFFTESLRLQQERPFLEGEEARHILRVLRLGRGDRIVLFDDTGWEYTAGIVEIQSGRVFFEVLEKKWVSRESPLRITLAVPLIRPQLLEWVFQKGTELGVTTFCPYYSRYSGRDFSSREWGGRQERWKRIIIEAAKQCGRNRLPDLRAPCSLDSALLTEAPALRLMPYEGENVYGLREVADRYPDAQNIMACVGPEGGFDPEEISRARADGFITFSLGPRILRAETAVLTLIGLIQHLWGDLSKPNPGRN
jgi:16S rRNA (uracil1498-N3)-methyltransferase